MSRTAIAVGDDGNLRARRSWVAASLRLPLRLLGQGLDRSRRLGDRRNPAR